MKILCLALIIAAGALASQGAHAAQYVYPTNGQDPATQARDESDCSAWATQQSGFDPSKAPAPVASAAPTAGLGGGAATAAIGALSGGGLGGVAGALPGLGQAAPGMSAAGVLGQAVAPHPQQAQASAASSGQAGFDQARAACLTGRGYSVK